MFYKADFECPQCGESFYVDIDGSDCKKLGCLEILAVTTEPEV